MPVMTDLTCVLPRPSIASLHAELTTEISQRLLGGAPVTPMSYEDVLAAVMAGTTNLMYGYVTQSLKENDPQTMCCDNLVRYGALHGIDLMASTRSKGYVGITGTPSAAISTNIRFVGESSREYKLDPGVFFNPTALDDKGAAVLRVVAVNAGAPYDLKAGSLLTVATTLPGINGTAIVLGNGLTGGSDNETCDHLRARVLAAEASGAIATNMAWYIAQASRYPGVTRVCADECGELCCDPSRITLYPFMEGVYGDVSTAPYGVPPAPVLAAMSEWMFGAEPKMGGGLAPVGIAGEFAAAVPNAMSAVANCFSGCPIEAHDRIVAALTATLRARYCVGSKLCKEQLRSVAYAAVGPDPCFSSLALSLAGPILHEDASFAYLACASFPVLGTVAMVPGGG